MKVEKIAELNPSSLDNSKIETLNKLSKEEILELAKAYNSTMVGIPYLNVELFLKGVSQGKSKLNYQGLANRLYNGLSDSFTVYNLGNAKVDFRQTATIAKTTVVDTIFKEPVDIEEKAESNEEVEKATAVEEQVSEEKTESTTKGRKPNFKRNNNKK